MAALVTDGQNVALVCEQLAVIDREYHILHGSSLILRNVSWLVSGQQVETLLLGPPILEVLGLNTGQLVEGAAERFAGVFDAENLLVWFI